VANFFLGLRAWHIRVTNLRRSRLRNLNLKFNSLSLIVSENVHVHIYDFFQFMGVRVGVAIFFLGQLIGIDKNITFQLKFLV